MFIFNQNRFKDVLIEAIVFYWVDVTVTHHHIDKDIYGLECFLQSSQFNTKYKYINISV